VDLGIVQLANKCVILAKQLVYLFNFIGKID